MRVMVIVPADRNSEAGALPDTKMLTEMGKFNEELVKAGIMLAGEGLHPTSKARRVKFSGGNPTVILYTRVTLIANGTANCASPATNGSGNSTVLLTGVIAPAGVAGFGKKLTVPGIDALPLPLDDFTALLKRGSYFRAKCSATPWHVRGTFAYSGTGQASDVSNPTEACS